MNSTTPKGKPGRPKVEGLAERRREEILVIATEILPQCVKFLCVDIVTSNNQPLEAKSRAVARPIPHVAPVMNMDLIISSS